MYPKPSLDEFSELASSHDLVPVYRRLLSDSLTPVLAFKALDDGESAACLFESVIGGEKVGRYSFIAVRPDARIWAYGDKVQTEGLGNAGSDQRLPLDALWDSVSGRSVATLPELPPLTGGAIGYAGYDVVRYVEDLPNPPEDDRNLPDLDFSIFNDLVIFDQVTKTLFVVTLVEVSKYDSVQAAYAAGQCRVAELCEQLQEPKQLLSVDDFDASGPLNVSSVSNFSKAAFEQAVEKCVDYIRAGDVFQVVIGQRLELPGLCDPFETYRSLRVVNPSPFMFFVRTPAVTLVGASPEIMCRVVDGVTTVRPLAGTRPRGKTDDEDRALAEELLADPKERAEHVMLVDLGRNDVGRVAEFGSIELSDLMTVEHYSHVMHISSTVDGTLKADLNAMDALKACLPAGTVSGAPKVRAMEIIDEIEPNRRGPYAGAVGYLDYGGNMDTCIALRTLVFSNDKIYVQASAGIVADSVPESEYQETLNKARAMLAAIQATIRRQQQA